MIRRTCLAAAAILAAGLPAAAQDREERQEPRPGSTSLGATTDHFLQTDGEALYLGACAGCHQPQGQGAIGAASYPPLAGNPRLEGGRYPAWIVLNGMGAMPALGGYMDDAQVVAVVSYIQENLGNRYEASLTEEDVADLRDAPAP